MTVTALGKNPDVLGGAEIKLNVTYESALAEVIKASRFQSYFAGDAQEILDFTTEMFPDEQP